jgi:hypothetical protein
MMGSSEKAVRTGTVEIKKCGFNTRPKLMVPATAGDDDANVDVLPELFKVFEGKTVKVTIEVIKP